MKIIEDDLSGASIAAFLEQHIEDMKATSPPESKHALDLEGLRGDDIRFWSVYSGEELLGCGALKELSSTAGEIKSMRTSVSARGCGVASALLQHIIQHAAARGYEKLLLETGSMAFFKPARLLYLKNGFQFREPFGEYREDPNSVFMELLL